MRVRVTLSACDVHVCCPCCTQMRKKAVPAKLKKAIAAGTIIINEQFVMDLTGRTGAGVLLRRPEHVAPYKLGGGDARPLPALSHTPLALGPRIVVLDEKDKPATPAPKRARVARPVIQPGSDILRVHDNVLGRYPSAKVCVHVCVCGGGGGRPCVRAC